MKILLTGANGQLGRELKRSLACLGDVTALGHADLDLGNETALRDTVHRLAPRIIVNAAAFTAVDKAESEPELAQRINATAPAILADEARKLGALLVHYSTDYVFDGSKDGAHLESDPTAPLSNYGRSKLAGEQGIIATAARHLILRTSWVYGLHGANFMNTMLRLGRERSELRVVGDQIGAPTWTRHLADATALLLARREPVEGLFHATAGGETTWHGYAEAIFTEALRLGMIGAAPTVRRITSADFPLPAARPKNSRLDCNKLLAATGLALPDWRTGLTDCLADSRH